MANDDFGHVALPKLYGAPAYGRPPRPVMEQAERPFDPDELPLESVQTDEERQHALEARQYAGGSGSDPAFAQREGSPLLRGRPFLLRSLTGRLRRGDVDDEAKAKKSA